MISETSGLLMCSRGATVLSLIGGYLGKGKQVRFGTEGRRIEGNIIDLVTVVDCCGVVSCQSMDILSLLLGFPW